MVSIIENELKEAFTEHISGRLAKAEALYKQILQSYPWHPDVNNNLGILLDGLGRHSEAVEFFKMSVEINPKRIENWENYITCLIKLDKKQEAKSIIQRSIKAGITSDLIKELNKTNSRTKKKLQS